MMTTNMSATELIKSVDHVAAQKEIVTVARRLAEAGTINLGGTEEQYV